MTMDNFWKFADIIRALAIAGGGFALMSVHFIGGASIMGAGVISLADAYRNSPERFEALRRLVK